MLKGNVSIENNAFEMPDGSVSIQAVFEKDAVEPTTPTTPGKACHRHEAIHNTDRCHVHPFDRLLRARHGGRRGCGTDCRRRDSAEEEAGVMMTGGVIAATR